MGEQTNPSIKELLRLAAQMRERARESTGTGYREKLDRAACDLEAEAERAKSRLDTAAL